MTRTLLVVEDDDFLAEQLCRFLRHEGYDVNRACHGAAAIDLLSHPPPPTAIILDLRMPVMNGWDVLDRLRQRQDWSNIPVIVTSADPSSSLTNVFAHLPKPFELDDLLDTLARASRPGVSNAVH